MKGRKFAILGIAILMAVATTAAVTAAAPVTLNYYHFQGNFTYGGCMVMTDESQTEHSFLGGHLFSTIVGTVLLQGSCALLPGITLPVGTPVPIAAIDFFNPFNDSFATKSYGMALLPSAPGSLTFVPIGVNGWKIRETPPTWCGYGYMKTGPGDYDYLVLPIKATYANNAFPVAPSTCFSGTPPVP